MKNILRNPDATDATGAAPATPAAVNADATATVPTVAVPAQPKRKGRPVGSVTLVNVTLAELTSKFNDPNQQIPVGKKFIESLKLAVKQTTAPAAVLTEAAKPEPAVAMTEGTV